MAAYLRATAVLPALIQQGHIVKEEGTEKAGAKEHTSMKQATKKVLKENTSKENFLKGSTSHSSQTGSEDLGDWDIVSDLEESDWEFC